MKGFRGYTEGNGESYLHDLTQDITFQLACRLRYHDDHIAIGLKSHLCAEYLLNRIVEQKLGHNPDNMTFAQKLKLIVAGDLLPEPIVQNLQRLNRFRNRLVHDLDYEVADDEMTIVSGNGNEKMISPKGKRYPQRSYLRLLGHACLIMLRNHMMLNLGIDPRYLETSSMLRSVR